MAEFTDLECNSPETAKAVVDYLKQQLTDEAQDNLEVPHVEARVLKSTVRLVYRVERDCRWRYGVDMQLLGYRDGVR